jgi:hypothetical protein
MSDPTEKTIPLNVRLKPAEPSAQAHAVNYSNVGVVQGIAYLDFGFIAWSFRPLSLSGLSGPIRDRSDGPSRPPIPSFHPCGDGRRCSRTLATADSAGVGQPAGIAAGEVEESILTRGQE